MLAIAITLLVLDISVPQEDFSDLWRGIADQWPSYLGYATSFTTIGGIWLIHHGLFRRLRYADSVLIRLNLLLLMLIAFLPFPTRLMAEALDVAAAERAAVLFYGATLLVISLLVTAMARHAVSRHVLVAEGEREGLVGLAELTSPSLGFYVVLIVGAILVPTIAAFGFLAVALDMVLRARVGVTPPPSARAGHRGGVVDEP